MAKRKRSNKVPLKIVTVAPPPVLQGNCFATFLDEARSIGNECNARRAFDAEVIEYLEHKGLTDDWSKWREAKHAAAKPANG